MNVARFLLRDGNKVGAEVSPEGLEVFSYEDQKGQVIHALATVKAEREFLDRSPRSFCPCTSAWIKPWQRLLVAADGLNLVSNDSLRF